MDGVTVVKPPQIDVERGEFPCFDAESEESGWRDSGRVPFDVMQPV
jgi:hypothetical protein